MAATRPAFRRFAPTVALALAASVAAVCAGRHYAEQEMAWRIQSEARTRGVEVAWSSLRLGWDGALRIDELRAFDPRGNRLQVRHVTMRWSASTMLRGQLLPARVALDAPDITITDPVLPAPSPPSAPALARYALSSLAPGPAAHPAQIGVSITDGTVDVRGLPGPVNHVALGGLRAVARKLGDGVNVVWTARCEDGCGARTAIAGNIRVRGQDVHADATAVDGFALGAVSRGLRDARASRIVVSKTAAGLEASVADIRANVQVGGWRGRLRADSAALGGEGHKLLIRPHVRLSRRPGGVSTTADSDPRALFDKLLARLDGVALEDGTIEIDDSFRLDAVHASVLDGRARLEASWRGSQFAIERSAGDPGTTVELDQFALDSVAQLVPLPSGWAMDGRVSGRVVIEPGPQWEQVLPLVRRRYVHPVTDEAAVRVTADLGLESASILAPKVSGSPIAPGGTLHIEALYAPAGEHSEDRLSVRAMRWSADGDALRFHAVAEARNVRGGEDPLAISVDAGFDEVDCETAFHSLPAGLLPRVGSHVRAEGRFAPTAHFAVDLRNAWTLELDLEGLPGTCKLTDLGPYSPDYLAGDFEQPVREGTSRDDLTIGPSSPRWTRLNVIPASVSAAAWMTEQVGFRHEGGLHLSHVRAAMRRNLEKGRFAYGGSTIAQQLVKNLFLTRRKTLSRKLEEALIVWRMQDVLPRERILELYLNCIEFGPDVYGITHAASYYFGKHPSQLTALEGAFLATLKPSPRSAARFKNAGSTPREGWWPRQLGHLMHRLHRRGYIGPDEVAQAAPYVLRFR